MELTNRLVDGSDPPEEEEYSRAQMEFLQKFGTVHRLKRCAPIRDFCPKRIVAMMVNSLRLCLRGLPMIKHRSRWLLRCVRRIARWFRRHLKQRSETVLKIVDNWSRHEESHRKAMKHKLYKEFSVSRDTAKLKIQSFVNLHTTEDLKASTVWALYWEKRERFRTAFAKWFSSFTVATNALAQVRTELERCSQGTTLGVGLLRRRELLQAELARLAPLQPRFRFDENSVST
eukprot:RCo023352